MAVRDVLVVGAGPSGLATAIAARKAGLDTLVVEKGVLVNSIFHFPTNMVFFTTPELLEIGGLPLITPYEKPTRLEALRYYRRVVDALGVSVVLHEAVERVEREDDGVFVVTTLDRAGVRRARHARAVVMAIGYYDAPNRLGIEGEDLPHVSHYYRDPHPFYRERVVVVGGKNSAAEAALELFRAGARVTLVHRGETLGESIKYWVRPDIENRIKEGSIPARFGTHVTAIRPGSVVLSRDGVEEELPADAVFLLTGYHADTDLLRSAGVALDPDSLAPVLDPETFETTVPGLFVAGGAIAGRHTGTVFIENGRLHGEKIAAALAVRLSSTL
ncbi:MAG: YpdA family putative bacillithiol disulfide reductase [Vicinamibacterales bacterium]